MYYIWFLGGQISDLRFHPPSTNGQLMSKISLFCYIQSTLTPVKLLISRTVVIGAHRPYILCILLCSEIMNPGKVVGCIYLFSWHVIGIFNSLWFVIDSFTFFAICELWKASGDIDKRQRMARRLANCEWLTARRTLNSEVWIAKIGENS